MTAEQHIIDFVSTHLRSESLLYNNRCFMMYINPTQGRKDQYESNCQYILDYFSS